MTGFGRAQKEFGNDNIFLEISSVNKRNLEVVLSGPREWQAYEVHASKLIKSKINRGRIRISLTIEFQNNDLVKIFDKEKMAPQLAHFKELIKEYCDEERINQGSLIEILKLSNVNDSIFPSLNDVFGLLDNLLSEAIDNLLKMKSNEGLELEKDMTSRVRILKELMPKIQATGSNMPKEFKQRLLQKLNLVCLDIEDERVLKEVSIFAEKSDISEEITRVNSHIQQLESTFEEPESIGRKIEFLLQEIGRELNTICSKSNKVDCTKLALDARVELDKIREQSLNIE